MRFEEVYGYPPAGVWSAPGRVNLIGEHTDYNDGYVLPLALPLRTTVAAAARPGTPEWTVWSGSAGEVVRFGEADLVPGRVTGWAGYLAGVVWALREAGFRVPGAELAVTSEVPVGAGLSSSAALACAGLTALAELAGLDQQDLPVPDRPALAWRAEHDYVGVPCGIMDQSAALLSRPGHALFLDCRDGFCQHIPFDPAAAGLALLVLDTRAPHRLVSGEYADRRTTCQRAAAALGVPALRDIPARALAAALADPGLRSERSETCSGGASAPFVPAGLEGPARQRVRHVVTENQRVLDTVALLRAGRVREIGPLLSASHASLRDDYQVSTPELDLAAATAEAAGALGARMTGAGFGGCVIALVETSAAEAATAAVTAAFASRGLTPPEWLVTVPDPRDHRPDRRR